MLIRGSGKIAMDDPITLLIITVLGMGLGALSGLGDGVLQTYENKLEQSDDPKARQAAEKVNRARQMIRMATGQGPRGL